MLYMNTKGAYKGHITLEKSYIGDLAFLEINHNNEDHQPYLTLQEDELIALVNASLEILGFDQRIHEVPPVPAPKRYELS